MIVIFVCVCVILHLKRHAFVIIFVQYNFLYDLPTHLQSLKNKLTGLAKSNSNSLANKLVSFRIPDVS
jgi:hypothetical protein